METVNENYFYLDNENYILFCHIIIMNNRTNKFYLLNSFEFISRLNLI